MDEPPSHWALIIKRGVQVVAGKIDYMLFLTVMQRPTSESKMTMTGVLSPRCRPPYNLARLAYPPWGEKTSSSQPMGLSMPTSVMQP